MRVAANGGVARAVAVSITMENTRLNADRDNLYREQIQDHVRSGNGHLIARGFATSQEELIFIVNTQKDTTHKLSLVTHQSKRQPR
jgi:hypothetical protein